MRIGPRSPVFHRLYDSPREIGGLFRESQGRFDEGPNQLLDIAVTDSALDIRAVVAALRTGVRIALVLNTLDQLQQMLVIPQHHLDGFRIEIGRASCRERV